jgi:predicted nucleotidyltransferase
MDQATDRLIEEYRKRLVALGIVPEKIIIFGSHADGTAGEDSDLDLLVVASGFETMDLWERMILLGRARAGMTMPMEILGITPSEAESLDAGSFIKDEVLEKGLLAG